MRYFETAKLAGAIEKRAVFPKRDGPKVRFISEVRGTQP